MIKETVTPEWIQDRMKGKGLSQADIVRSTGIPKSNISAWLSGIRPMSQIAKAMFYFMLK